MGFRRVVRDRSCIKGDCSRDEDFCWKLRLEVVVKFRCSGFIVFRRYRYVVR